MSAPDTNIETQEDRHAPSLIGIKGAMIFGALVMIGLIFFAIFRAENYGASAFEGEAAAESDAATGVVASD